MSSVILDSSNLLYMCQHSLKRDNILTYKSLIRSFMIRLFSLVEKRIFCNLFLLFDLPSFVSTYRQELLPEYKQHRHSADTLEDKQAHRAALGFLVSQLPGLGFPTVCIKSIESDDISYAISRHFSCNNGLFISSDNDWKLNLKKGWSVYQIRQDTTVTYEDFKKEMFHENPNIYFLYYKCLIGDPGDNVKGVYGIGPKKATALIKGLSEGKTLSDFPFAQRVIAGFDIVERNMKIFTPEWILGHKKTLQRIEEMISNTTYPSDPLEAWHIFCDTLDDGSLRDYWETYMDIMRNCQKGRVLCNL